MLSFTMTLLLGTLLGSIGHLHLRLLLRSFRLFVGVHITKLIIKLTSAIGRLPLLSAIPVILPPADGAMRVVFEFAEVNQALFVAGGYYSFQSDDSALFDKAATGEIT